MKELCSFEKKFMEMMAMKGYSEQTKTHKRLGNVK